MITYMRIVYLSQVKTIVTLKESHPSVITKYKKIWFAKLLTETKLPQLCDFIISLHNMPRFVMSYYVVELFPRLLEYIRLYHCSRKYNGCCCDKPRGRFNFFIVLILRCNLEASKTETLDLCQLPRLTIWGHKTQKPHASLGILGQIIKRLRASYGFQQMNWKKTLAPHQD